MSYDPIDLLNLQAPRGLRVRVREFVRESQLIPNALSGFAMNGSINTSHEREYEAFEAGIAELCHLVERIFQRPDLQNTEDRLWILDQIAAEFDNCPIKWFIVSRLNALVAARSESPVGTRIAAKHSPSEYASRFHDIMTKVLSLEHATSLPDF